MAQLELSSIESRKTKTKVIALANQKGHRQSSEPIKTRRKYMWPARSAGKRVRTSYDWFWLFSASDNFGFINCNLIGSDSTSNLIGVTIKHTPDMSFATTKELFLKKSQKLKRLHCVKVMDKFGLAYQLVNSMVILCAVLVALSLISFQDGVLWEIQPYHVHCTKECQNVL